MKYAKYLIIIGVGLFFLSHPIPALAWCENVTSSTSCGFSGLNWCAVGTSCNTGTLSGPQISVSCPTNQKLVNNGIYCDYGNKTYSFSGSSNCVTESSCPADNLSCQNINLSPTPQSNHNGMPVYLGNETISITVTGSTSSQNVEVYWRPAYEAMSSSGWNKINGTYDSNTHIFTATWNLQNDPNIQDSTTGQARPQEIIIAANNSGSSGFCSGSPCSGTCPGGAYWVSGDPAVCSPNPASCCTGCQKKIVIDPTANLNTSNAIDLKEYLLFNPGNYWGYEGTNFTYPVSDPLRTFISRIEIEPPTIMCGHKAVGMRFLKDKASGYWGEKFSYFDPGRWDGNLALRSSMFYFDNDSKWSDRFTGSPWFITYGVQSDPNQFKGLGPINDVTGYETSGSQHFYYSPYLYAPRYLPADPTTWKFKREDATFDYDPNIPNDACKYESQDQYKNDYNTRGHGWETKYSWEDIQTPAYSGQALRIIFLEYGDPNNGFLLREDWFFAKNIGLVQIKVKDIYQKSIHDHNLNPSMPVISRNNCGSECDNNTVMTDPMLTIKLKNYYLGTPLTISSSVNWVKPGVNSTWPVSFSNNYTGFIDANVDQLLPDGTTQNVFNGYWSGIWVQDGNLIAPVPENSPRGTFIYKFRRHLPDITADKLPKGETLDSSFTNNLPWSNPITVSFTDNPTITPTPIPLPGDLNHDGKVNISDYNTLLQNFGTTICGNVADIDGNCKVDIFDYNILVGNFGK